MTAKCRNLLRIGLAVLLLGAMPACSPTLSDGPVSVTITSHGDGSAVAAGQAVMIDSTITAAAGVDRVDLTVDGQVVRHDTPPEENPTTFRVSQLWTPASEGQATITVVAYDADGALGRAAVTLQVVASDGAVPTAGPGSAVVPEQAETPVPPVTTEAGCTLDSQYVADVTIPDGTVMDPGEMFVKTWRMQNSGTCDWEAGVELVFVSGEQMGGPASVPLPALAAGGETDVSVNLAAPSSDGTHTGTWRVRSGEGETFGTNLTVEIEVGSPATEPAPTAPPPTAAWPAVDPQPTPVVVDPRLKLPFTERVMQEATLPGYAKREVVVECPAKSVVTGGGFSGSPDVVFGKNHKTAGNGWTVDAKNNSGSNETIRVYAVCLYNVPGASSDTVLAQVTVKSHDRRGALATCPAGSIITGGGWVTHESLRVSLSSMTGSDTWYVIAHNDTSTDYPLYSVAVCLSGVGGTVRGYSKSVMVPGGSLGQVAHRCPTDRIMTGGGFSTDDFAVYINSGPWGAAPDEEWRVYAKNTGSTGEGLSADCVCLEIQ